MIICCREVMKTLLNRYKDRLGLTQDQLSEIEVNVTSTMSCICSYIIIHAAGLPVLAVMH